MKLKNWIVPIIFIVLLTIGVVGLANKQDKKLKKLEDEISYIETHYEEKVIDTCSRKENIDTSFYELAPEEGLIDALIYLDVPCPCIVYAQAILETGWFTSNGCVNKNNLFGIFEGNRLKKYNHWKESVKDYKKLISSRYINPDENYYHFLQRIKYARDPQYTTKLKQIIREL